jgi:hypothetical protein
MLKVFANIFFILNTDFLLRNYYYLLLNNKEKK